MTQNYSLVGFASCNGCGIWYEDPQFPDEMGTPIPGRDLVDIRKELRAGGWKITQKIVIKLDQNMKPHDLWIPAGTTALCPDCKEVNPEIEGAGITWQWGINCNECYDSDLVDLDHGDLAYAKRLWREGKKGGTISQKGWWVCWNCNHRGKQ